MQSIRIDRDVPIQMRDGITLRANIYRPDDNGSYPAILIRTAYNKHLTKTEGFLIFIEAVYGGYAVVVQDIRGRFASEGKWNRLNMFEIENLDGYDSVEWVARQPWCDSNVGMAGGSYLSAMAWITAMENPPHLKAISPWIGDMGPNMQPPPKSGKVNFYTAANAIPLTALDLIDKLKDEGEDINELSTFINEVLINPNTIINYLPLKDLPLAKFKQIREMWDARLKPMSYEEYTKHRKYEKIKVPIFHIGGWFDQLEWATFENYKRIQEYGGNSMARENQFIMVGPWMHGPPLSFVGEMGFGHSAEVSGIDIHNRTMQFFDKYLKNKEVDIPPVRYFVMGKNQWRNADSWPPSSTEWKRLYFHSRGNANSSRGDGVLDSEKPRKEPQDTYLYDPLDPVQTLGGKIVPSRDFAPGSFDQSSIELRNDVLCYTSSELLEDLEVTGPVKLHLFAATTAEDTDFTARLIDVHPNERAYNIVDGIQRVSYRNWKEKIEPVIPSKVYEYIIDLGNISMLFQKGHRIRLEVSSSNFPLYDRNMNTGNQIGEDTVGNIAKQTIYHQEDYASYIELPTYAN